MTLAKIAIHERVSKNRKEIIMFHVKYVQVERIIIKFSCSPRSHPVSFLKLCFHNNFTNLSSLPLFFLQPKFVRCLNHTRMFAVIYWKMISFMLYRGQNREDEIKLISFCGVECIYVRPFTCFFIFSDLKLKLKKCKVENFYFSFAQTYLNQTLLPMSFQSS